MAVFNYENFAANLPDAFYKVENSNNYKLLLIEKHIYDRIMEMYQSIFEILDINNATGKVLDMYGKRLNLARGTLSDKQYLIRLKAKIAQSMSNGTRDSIAKALAYVLSTTTDKIYLASVENTNSIEIVNLPLTVLLEADFSAEQVAEIVESMLPQGVHVSAANFTGTFEFADTENEYDENSGFSDLDGTMGGYLGLGL